MVQFKPERIPEILGENLNPNFLVLNLNPRTASRANKEDITTPVITWATILGILIICFIMFKNTKLAFVKRVVG